MFVNVCVLRMCVCFVNMCVCVIMSARCGCGGACERQGAC